MASLDKKPRLKNPIRKKPYFETIAPGIALGYRRNQGAGAWLVRAADGKGGNWIKGFAVADDLEQADGKAVMTYADARAEAGKLARMAPAPPQRTPASRSLSAKRLTVTRSILHCAAATRPTRASSEST